MTKTPRKSMKSSGLCKLTNMRGDFVKAHLIPQALTQPAQKGLPFYQLGPNAQPIKRWTSWYDPNLVTQAGEDILTAHDTWAIAELRKHKLVWSSWGAERNLGSQHHKIGSSPWGVRKLENLDGGRLRLFLLTLLWRAAATSLPEFSEVQLPEHDVERIRRMILDANPNPISFYPAQLTQISTLGLIHNHTPIADIKLTPRLDAPQMPSEHVPFFRFYFDGLVVHFDRRHLAPEAVAQVGNLVVGAEQSLLVTTQTYENSYQMIQVESIRRDSARHR